MLNWPRFLLLLTLFLSACSTMKYSSPARTSMLAQGKRDFAAGYYKHAIKRLLPLACDGDREAQYAIGYLYYYGYGVAQDTDVGYFWIKRSSEQYYEPATQALAMINNKNIALPTKT